MYNSVVIRFLVKIWDTIVSWYKESLVKKIGSRLADGFSRLAEGSRLRALFSKDLSIIENTWIYRIYTVAIDLLNRIFEKINRSLFKIQRTSKTSRAIEGLFKNNLELIKTFSIFIMFFGLGIILNSIFRGVLLTGSVIASIFLMLISALVLEAGERILVVLNNSWIINFILGIFKIEEGGDQWW